MFDMFDRYLVRGRAWPELITPWPSGTPTDEFLSGGHLYAQTNRQLGKVLRIGEYTVRVERTEHYSRWEILRGGSEWADDDGRPVYEPEVGANTTANPDDAKKITGIIKWDGCLEFDGDRPPHLCGPEMGAAFAKALLAIWDVAKEAIVQYDGD